MSDRPSRFPADAGSQSWKGYVRLAWAPALAGALLVAPPAFAQTQPEPQDAVDVPLDVDPVATRDPHTIVVTAIRAEQHGEEVGQAVTVFTRDDITHRQTVAIGDLLATAPGVTLSRNGSLGGFTGVRIRGAEAEQTLVVIDGIRVNDPSSPGGGYDFANLLAGQVDRVEVLRGPDSVPWGSQAIGGVVNIVTADPARLAGGSVAGHASVEGGYAGQLYGAAGVEGRAGALSGALDANYLRSDGISSAASGTERDGYRQIGAAGRVGIEIGNHAGIDLRGWYADSHLRYDGFAATPPFGPADGPQSGTTQELYGYAGIHADLADERFRNRLGFTIADINRDNVDPFFSSSARGRSERYEYGGDFRVTDQLRLVGGAERENSRFDDGTAVARTGSTGVYAQAIVTPIDPLTLTGGIRYDDHDAFAGHTTAGADAAVRLGQTVLRASYGEGFKAPTLYQLYSFYGRRQLRPERARSFDLGIQHYLLGSDIVVAMTYFHRDTRDQIDFRACVNAECAAQPYGLYDNIARARGQGVEAELRLRPVYALTVTANASYIDATNRSPGANFGRDLARRPHATASIDADYRFPAGLRVGGTLRLVGHSFDDAANGTRLDGYALASVRAELPLGERLSLYGRIENAGDARYQTAAGYGTFGRAAYGGVRVRFD